MIEGLPGEVSIAELCGKEGIAEIEVAEVGGADHHPGVVGARPGVLGVYDRPEE